MKQLTDKPKVRDSNIELLRILCMSLIIIHHFLIHSPWSTFGEGLSINNHAFLSLLGMWPALAINCFVIITGYFMCSYTGSTKEKLFTLWKDRFFFSFTISLLALAFGKITFSFKTVMQMVFPIITCRHNYVTTFFFLYLLIPFINKGLTNLTKPEFSRLILISTLIMSACPTILGLKGLWSNNTYVYLLWMIYLYCLGAFFRLYPLNLPWKTILLCIVVLILLITEQIEPNFELIPVGYTTSNRNNLFMLIGSVALFNVFIRIRCPSIRFINWISSSTFAVLLLHDDPIIRGILWSKILQLLPNLGNSAALPVITFVLVPIIYLFCALVDHLYKGSIAKHIKFPSKQQHV